MEPCLVVLNPVAGQGAARSRLGPWIKALKTAGGGWELVETEGPGHATELASAALAEGREFVVAAGGDGTANEVLNGLLSGGAGAEERPRLGVFPIGRGNDFAHGVKAPGTPAAFAALYAAKNYGIIDAGRIEDPEAPRDGRFFGNGVGIGFDALVGFVAEKAAVFRGFSAYLWGALSTMAAFPEAPSLEIVWEGGRLDLKATQVSLMNGRRMGGAFLMAPDADPRDGLLDLCAVEVRGRAHMASLVLRFMAGSQAADPATRCARGLVFTISSRSICLPIHADGETIATAARSVRISVVPAALRFLGT